MKEYRIRLEREGYHSLWFSGIRPPFESSTHYRFTVKTKHACIIKGEGSVFALIERLRGDGSNMDRIVMEVWDDELQAFIDVLSIG
jgi:hypothetical protein